MLQDFARQKEEIIKVRPNSRCSDIEALFCMVTPFLYTHVAVILQETEKRRPGANRFVGQHDSMEEALKKETVGLVILEDFRNKRKALEEDEARKAARTDELK